MKGTSCTSGLMETGNDLFFPQNATRYVAEQSRHLNTDTRASRNIALVNTI